MKEEKRKSHSENEVQKFIALRKDIIKAIMTNFQKNNYLHGPKGQIYRIERTYNL
jgi:hypothetical protein